MSEDVKDQVKDQQKEVDEKGVPWQNRFKELERKFTDRDREFEELKTWKANYEAEAAREAEHKPSSQEKLMQFVGDPDAYIESKVTERERKRLAEQFNMELGQVRPWLQSQKDYNADTDNARLLEIEKEYALSHPSPLLRAEKAWDILRKEKAWAKMNANTDDARREEAANRAALEGTGKATPKEKTVTRQDIIRKLAEAEAKGDLDASIKYTSLLEDIR